MPSLKLSLTDIEVKPDEMMVIAIHSPGFASHEVAHFLNKKMQWNLVHVESLSEKGPYRPFENPACLLDVFSHTDDVNRVQYFLLGNRFQQQIWIPKMGDVDYWLVITGSGMEHLDVKETLHLLSDTDFIFSATSLSFETETGRISPVFKYFQSFYNEMEERENIRSFE